MKKLTDEQISRVLSQHANGQLSHSTFGYTKDDGGDCGCVAGVALEIEALGCRRKNMGRAMSISEAVGAVMDAAWTYPSDTDDMLRLLEKAKLA